MQHGVFTHAHLSPRASMSACCATSKTLDQRAGFHAFCIIASCASHLPLAGAHRSHPVIHSNTNKTFADLYDGVLEALAFWELRIFWSRESTADFQLTSYQLTDAAPLQIKCVQACSHKRQPSESSSSSSAGAGAFFGASFFAAQASCGASTQAAPIPPSARVSRRERPAAPTGTSAILGAAIDHHTESVK